MREKEDEPGSKSEVQSALQLQIQDTVLVQVMGEFIYLKKKKKKSSTHTSVHYVYTCRNIQTRMFTRAVASLQRLRENIRFFLTRVRP